MQLFRQHFGSIVLALAIVLAALIYAQVNRYVVVPSTGRGESEVFDRWTGR